VGPTATDETGPDPSRVRVYFPFHGRVSGLGLAAPVPDGYAFVKIRSPDDSVIVPHRADGSFEFSITAVGEDVLEMSHVTSDALERLESRPTSIEVPLAAVPLTDLFCCPWPSGGGACQSVEEPTCVMRSDHQSWCSSDDDCHDLTDRFALDPDGVRVRPAEQAGTIVVDVDSPELALLLLDVQPSGGGPTDGAQQIVDERGRATLSMASRAPHVLTVRAFTLDYRSSRKLVLSQQ